MGKLQNLREPDFEAIDERIRSQIPSHKQMYGLMIGCPFGSYKDLPKPDYIHESLGMVKGTHIDIHSEAKKGKTTFVAGMLASMEHGYDFVGEQIDKMHTWFLIDEGEVTIQELANRTKVNDAIVMQLHDNSRENLESTINTLIESYKTVEIKPELIIFDAARSWFKVKDGNDYETATKAMSEVNRLRDELGVTIISLSHMSKGAQSNQAVNSLHGSVAWGAQFDTVIGLDRTDNRIVLTIDGRIVTGRQIAARFNPLTRTFSTADLPQTEQINNRREGILDILARGSMRQIEISEETGMGRSATQHDLRTLCDRGEVEQFRVGRQILYRLANNVQVQDVEGDA